METTPVAARIAVDGAVGERRETTVVINPSSFGIPTRLRIGGIVTDGAIGKNRVTAHREIGHSPTIAAGEI